MTSQSLRLNDSKQLQALYYSKAHAVQQLIGRSNAKIRIMSSHDGVYNSLLYSRRF